MCCGLCCMDFTGQAGIFVFLVYPHCSELGLGRCICRMHKNITNISLHDSSAPKVPSTCIPFASSGFLNKFLQIDVVKAALFVYSFKTCLYYI
jgi:hypothetical protein